MAGRADRVSDEAAGEMLRNVLNPPPEPGPPYLHTLSAPDPEEAVKWLREQVEGDRAAAVAACDGNMETAAWRLRDHPGDSAFVRDGLGDTVVYDEGLPLEAEAVHIALHDPRDVIADCEAKLAILDEHGPYEMGDEVYCRICGDCPQVDYPCPTVHLLAAGFRHRDGYRQHWGEPVPFSITGPGVTPSEA
jgi:hypothetical protein